ncbi:hypothetical protein NDU88_003840 [Pleurodeles waltl]|uniref:Uncharacterized protein n=1 Tax=Pleurodeles waltl TaxID=8319 RepID=A0AAV7V3L4_PLEWA|nr:hypothetical protein NDU88_003840 [Pleurodeles waltl]
MVAPSPLKSVPDGKASGGAAFGQMSQSGGLMLTAPAPLGEGLVSVREEQDSAPLDHERRGIPAHGEWACYSEHRGHSLKSKAELHRARHPFHGLGALVVSCTTSSEAAGYADPSSGWL